MSAKRPAPPMPVWQCVVEKGQRWEYLSDSGERLPFAVVQVRPSTSNAHVDLVGAFSQTVLASAMCGSDRWRRLPSIATLPKAAVLLDDEEETTFFEGTRVGLGPVCGASRGSRWCPMPADHGGPCTCDWKVAEVRP